MCKHLSTNCASWSPKSVNNVLTVLNTMLKRAVEWGAIEQLPCTIRHLKAASASVDFYSFEEYERLLKAALELGTLPSLVVLLGGDAGLRAGEMRALRWSDVDLDRGQMRVERNDWRGQISSTKGGRTRYVPMTDRLRDALRRHRHLRSPLVLTTRDRHSPRGDSWGCCFALQERRTSGAAGRTSCVTRSVRIWRCAGHQPERFRNWQAIADLATTQRYMHLSPTAAVDAIGLLNSRPRSTVGDDVETVTVGAQMPNG